MGVGEGKTDAIACFEELCRNAVAEQEKFLMDRLAENKDTEYGKLFGFEDIHSVEEYQKELPITFHYDYETIIERQINGEERLYQFRQYGFTQVCADCGEGYSAAEILLDGCDPWDDPQADAGRFG